MMRRTPRAALAFVVGIVAATGLGCGSPGAKPPETGPRTGGGTTSPEKPASQPGAHPGQIVGEIEREAPGGGKRRMRIWGQVHRVKSGEHGALPPAAPVSAGGLGDPVTEIRNDTQFELTIWFAGKCPQEVKVPSRTSKMIAFCPGTYHIATEVEDKDYLPLIRENQEFKAGTGYLIQVVVKRRPK